MGCLGSPLISLNLASVSRIKNIGVSIAGVVGEAMIVAMVSHYMP